MGVKIVSTAVKKGEMGGTCFKCCWWVGSKLAYSKIFLSLESSNDHSWDVCLLVGVKNKRKTKQKIQ